MNVSLGESNQRHATLTCAIFLLISLTGTFSTFSQPRTSGSVTITAEPNAIIWIDEIRRGVTDASGRLEITKVSQGRHTVRVRATGFKETTAPLLAGRRSLTVKLVRTADRAELAFQEAERARELATDDALRTGIANRFMPYPQRLARRSGA